MGFGVARFDKQAMPEPQNVGRVTGRFPRFFVFIAQPFDNRQVWGVSLENAINLIMFKDYYLILGVGKNAIPEDIENAYNDAVSKMNDKTSSAYLQEVKEAYAVLSRHETKILYDKELATFNWSEGFANHTIKNQNLGTIINTLQGNTVEQEKNNNNSNILLQEENTNSKQISTPVDSQKMPLMRRFVGTLFDKLILIVVFAVLGYVITGPYVAPVKLGSYLGILKISPNNYKYIDEIKIRKYNSGEYYKGSSTAYQDLVRLYNEPPHIGSTKENDMSITLSFVALNMLYYFFFELLLSASPGKRMFGGVLYDNADDKVNFGMVFARLLVFSFMMAVSVFLLHFGIGFNYYVVFFLFFLVMDLPVLLVKRSLLDICTGTKYCKSKQND